MRFREVTSQVQNAIVDTPGHKAHGQALRDALPGMANGRTWQAVCGGYSWAIVFEPGHPSWTEDQRNKHVDYSASYRRLEHHSSSETIRVDGAPFATFAAAESACGRVWRQIRSVN